MSRLQQKDNEIEQLKWPFFFFFKEKKQQTCPSQTFLSLRRAPLNITLSLLQLSELCPLEAYIHPFSVSMLEIIK